MRAPSAAGGGAGMSTIAGTTATLMPDDHTLRQKSKLRIRLSAPRLNSYERRWNERGRSAASRSRSFRRSATRSTRIAYSSLMTPKKKSLGLIKSVSAVEMRGGAR